ncbi:unnamed protein product [Diabrotica balteata]|uniref:RRM domain-containing protein n=1 Tax=Diabrotica balteata TaxID=107213 RepID=A0A9P0E0R5_DIABA|nr:unnamed protein product [Diabrotica balteata]
MGDRSRDRTTRVYVGGLTESIKKEDLEGEFEKYGKLNSVWVAFNPPGFAFIEFNNHTDAETACDNLNGTEFLGAKLRVEIAKGRPRRGGPRGGFRGSRGSRGRRFDSFEGRVERRFDSRGGGGRFGGRSFDRRRDFPQGMVMVAVDQEAAVEVVALTTDSGPDHQTWDHQDVGIKVFIL